MIKKEKTLTEIMKKLSNEELLRRYINRGGKLSIEAAKEILWRQGQGMIDDFKKYLIAILKNLKAKGLLQEDEVVKIKEETIQILTRDYLLDENDLLVILGVVGSHKIHKIKEEVARKFFSERDQITNPTLIEIVRQIPSLREEATGRILKQKPNSQDYFEIVEELNGELQISIVKKLLEKGIPKEDACWLLESLPPPLPEMIWKKLNQKGKIKKLSLDQLEGIFRYTDDFLVREEAKKEALRKVKEEEEKIQEKSKNEPNILKLYHRLSELNEFKKKFEQSPQEEEKILTSPAQST